MINEHLALCFSFTHIMEIVTIAAADIFPDLGSRANRALHQTGHTSHGMGLRGLIRDSIGSLLQQAVTL